MTDWTDAQRLAAFLESIHLDSGWAVALFTAALVGVGVYQWRAIREQGRATEHATRIAERNTEILASTQRPYIVIKNLHMLEGRRHIRADGMVDLTLWFELWNYGPTPAWPEVVIVHARAHHTAQLDGEPLPDLTHSEKALLGGVVTPNEGHPYEVSYPEHQQLCVTQDEWQRVDNGELNLFFYGVVLYHDGRGDPHQSVFGMRYANDLPPFGGPLITRLPPGVEALRLV